ncbi:type II toxin-antitoxin system HipA family toxin [Microbacterium sp.]|uniref:type II toxin-antitoxin system HipA family toxin n=1 Tax=Microbacterium sp. TaxID=51671 RepID=UPI003A8DD9E7
MSVDHADVYRDGILAASLIRQPDGIRFSYANAYLESGRPPVATTLPLGEATITTGGAVPPFFAGLLPEGRRLGMLRRSLKASADDELTLLCGIGSDTVGNVQVVRHDEPPTAAEPAVEIAPSAELDFTALTGDAAPVDRVGLAGAQDKVSGRMINIPARKADERYILKLNPPEYPHVVENEAFFLAESKACRIPTVTSRVLIDRFGTPGLLVTRFDRTGTESGLTSSAVEDGCQALGRWPADKYSVSTEDVFGRLAGLCAAERVAARDLFRQLCFAIITGNGDLHAKNISVLADAHGEWRIAPAYDLPSTAFYGDHTLAMSIQGRRTGISRRRLLEFAESMGLRRPGAARWLDEILQRTAEIIPKIEGGALPFDAAQTRAAVRQLRNNRRLLAEGR